MLRAAPFLLLFSISSLSYGQTVFDAKRDCDYPVSVRESRPASNEGITKVGVGVYLIDLPAINDVDQSYLADVWIRLSWKDSRLAHGEPTPCMTATNEVWNPGAFLLNQRSVERKLKEAVEVRADGTVIYRQRFYGTFSMPADLSAFPFDEQRLPVTLIAPFGSNELILAPDTAMTGMAEQMSIPNWRIGAPAASSGEYTVLPTLPSIAKYEAQFPAKRRSGYYIWKLIVPTSIVVFMSWTAFWISPEYIAPRVGLSATAMLTLIAFRLALDNFLPPIPYMTQMDVFTIGSTVIVFAALLGSVAATALWDWDRQIVARWCDRVARVLFPLAFITVMVISFA